MPYRVQLLLAICALTLGACDHAQMPSAAEAAKPAIVHMDDDALPAVSPIAAPAAITAADISAPAESSVFDPASVLESSATLPRFPFFKTPDGLVSTLDDKQRNIAFDREHMIAGAAVTAVEGKVFRDHFKLVGGDREYSEIEFHRNYANAIRDLGGVEVSREQFTDPVNDAFGGREAVDQHYHGTCASSGCENHTYLIRQGGKEFWMLVSTGAIPLHGNVVVLEREAMKSSLALLSASDMKKAIDTAGKVALQVNFDTDKATLRPDATPIIDEIAKLLSEDPALKLSIDGHTDNTGTAQRNRELSKQRAETVRAALIVKGIDSGRLAAQGFGQEQPVADNASDAGRAQNRRVELVKQS